MKNLFLLLSACLISCMLYAQTDVNFALSSQGASATASSGNAGAAIDGNIGSRWESEFADPQWWLLDLGQDRTFNTIQIVWEGAYGKTFTIETSVDGVNYAMASDVSNQSLAGFPYTQTLDITEVTARYVRFNGTQRGTPYGYSFYEFRVYKAGASVLTSLAVTPASAICKVGEGVELTVAALDQNGRQMDVTPQYTVSPADAGSIANGRYTPAKKGMATITASVDGVSAAPFTVFAYEGNNLAKDNLLAASGYDGGDTPAKALDGNDGSLWNAHAVTGGSLEERTYDAWFTVDLKGFYDIDLISIHFEGACSQAYHVDMSTDNVNWTPVYNGGRNGIVNYTAFHYENAAQTKGVRYLRFWSTIASSQYGMKVYEFQVYGSLVPDTEAPVINSATFLDASFNNLRFTLDATDNLFVSAAHVEDAAHQVNADFAVDNNILTVTGLNPQTAYSFTIWAKDAAGNRSANSVSASGTTIAHLTEPQVAAPLPALPASRVIAVYSDAYTVFPSWSYKEDWGDHTTYAEKVVDGDHYCLYNNLNWLGWACASAVIALPMDHLHLDIWSENDGSIGIVPIYGGQGLTTDDNHRYIAHLRAQQWNSIDIDLAADLPGLNLASIFQFKFDSNEGLAAFAIDNVYFYTSSESNDTEAPTDVTATVASVDYFSAVIQAQASDNSGVVYFRVYNGETLLLETAAASAAPASLAVSGLAMGTTYNLSVVASDFAGNNSEPVAVDFSTLTGPTAAPVPTHAPEYVSSIYSDAYESDTYFWAGNWYQTTVMTEGEIAPDEHAMMLSKTNYLGWEINNNAPYNITRHSFLHIDLYSPIEATLSVLPISVGLPDNAPGFVMAATPGQWASFDINLATIPGFQKDKFIQIKFYDGNGGTYFIDNVYFWGDQLNAIDAVNAESTATKLYINGHVFISRDGVLYDVLGRRVE